MYSIQWSLSARAQYQVEHRPDRWWTGSIDICMASYGNPVYKYNLGLEHAWWNYTKWSSLDSPGMSIPSFHCPHHQHMGLYWIASKWIAGKPWINLATKDLNQCPLLDYCSRIHASCHCLICWYKPSLSFHPKFLEQLEDGETPWMGGVHGLLGWSI